MNIPVIFWVVVLLSFYTKTEHSSINTIAKTFDSFQTTNNDTLCNNEYTYDIDSLLNDTSEFEDCGNLKFFFEKETEIQQLKPLVNQYNLPKQAKIIEYTQIDKFTDRALMLWMLSPRIVINCDNDYTCPETTSGKVYYWGKVFISLIDTDNKRIINTLRLSNIEDGSEYQYTTCFPMPIAIANPKKMSIVGEQPYPVEGGTETENGKAKLLKLNDINGDGKALEFGFYEQQACMGCMTTLFGYSPKQDKLIHFTVTLKVSGAYYDDNQEKTIDTTYHVAWQWVDYLFCQPFDKKMRRKFEIDYSGRGGNLDTYNVKYNPDKECFEGEMKSKVVEMDYEDNR